MIMDVPTLTNAVFAMYKEVVDAILQRIFYGNNSMANIRATEELLRNWLHKKRVSDEIAEFRVLPSSIENDRLSWEIRVRMFPHNEHFYILSDQGIKIKSGDLK